MSPVEQHAFETFWQAYPRRVGKLAAASQFVKALRLASLEELLEGVDRYKRTKPAYADWCHPVTFLRQGRWMDEVGEAAGEHWKDECQRLHGGTCQSWVWHQALVGKP